MNKIVVISGISRGLGRETAEKFAASGWNVIGAGRSERPSELSEVIEYERIDAGDVTQTSKLWRRLAEEYGECEVVLVNNAGGYIGGLLVELEASDYLQMIQSCYLTAVSMTHGLVDNFEGAKIINVISTAALEPSKKNSAYGAAKAAERHFFQSLKKELPSSYKITNLYPDMISSDPSHEKSIDKTELAEFILEQAEFNGSYYLADVAIRTSL